MKIATNSQILETLNLLQSRSKRTLNLIYNKMRLAEVSGKLPISILSSKDFVDMQSALETINVFELIKNNYINKGM